MAKRNRNTVPARPAAGVMDVTDQPAPADAPTVGEDLAQIPDAETAEAMMAGELPEGGAPEEADGAVVPDAPLGEGAAAEGENADPNLPDQDAQTEAPDRQESEPEAGASAEASGQEPGAPAPSQSSDAGASPAEALEDPEELPLVIQVPEPMPVSGLVSRQPSPRLTSRQSQVQNGLYQALSRRNPAIRRQGDVYGYLLDLIADASGIE